MNVGIQTKTDPYEVMPGPVPPFYFPAGLSQGHGSLDYGGNELECVITVFSLEIVKDLLCNHLCCSNGFHLYTTSQDIKRNIERAIISSFGFINCLGAAAMTPLPASDKAAGKPLNPEEMPETSPRQPLASEKAASKPLTATTPPPGQRRSCQQALRPEETPERWPQQPSASNEAAGKPLSPEETPETSPRQLPASDKAAGKPLTAMNPPPASDKAAG
uniref:Uncharacterized protein n=1 Tax=Sphaerodactylus townsendi TaxID=933632 RepID=A0ACB8GCD3_9SAUR